MRFRLLSFLAATVLVTLFFRVESLWHNYSAQAIEQAQAQERPTASSEDKPVGLEEANAEPVSVAPVQTSDASAVLPSDPFELTDAEIELLQDLSLRRKDIETREAALDEREALLQAAELRLEQQVARLQDLRTEIEGLLKQYDEEQEEKLAALVSIYEAMKPKEAAPIFEALDLRILLDVLERMKERKIAPIMAKMNPQRAREITVALAARRELNRPRD